MIKNVLMVSPEMAPFAKTGGLADVVSALSLHLSRKKYDVRVVMPYYKSVREHYEVDTALHSMCVVMGEGEVWCAVRKLVTADGVTVYFIDHKAFFDRDGIYHDSNYNDYSDNPRRFGFLARAALQVAIDLNFKPDIVHANDWQTALVPVYLKRWFWNNPHLSSAASVLTIHNASYQGIYPTTDYNWLGLNPEDFNADIFEDYGRINFLKGGIYYSDVVNTVSPTHAEEIKRPGSEFGIAPYISNKGDNFIGILNGVDYSSWSPQNDSLIPKTYTNRSLAGKKICKEELQKTFKLNNDPHIATIGMIGRVATQKGFDIVKGAIEDILSNMHVQFVVLGSGDNELEHFFGELPMKFPGKASSFIGFSNELAHLIEAGSDMFLMPSRFEPCGLNQLYSLKYGTLPIVRNTGGLADTVINYDEYTGTGTGFKFDNPDPVSLYYTVGWAVSTYYDRPSHFSAMIKQAMSADFGWSVSIQKYMDFYKQAVKVKNEYDNRFNF